MDVLWAENTKVSRLTYRRENLACCFSRSEAPQVMQGFNLMGAKTLQTETLARIAVSVANVRHAGRLISRRLEMRQSFWIVCQTTSDQDMDGQACCLVQSTDMSSSDTHLLTPHQWL